jgi:predicted HTH transcriptional regulator
VINAIVHRDYSMPSQATVEIYELTITREKNSENRKDEIKCIGDLKKLD